MSDARKTVEEWPQTDIENKPEVWDSPVKSAGCEPALSPHDKDVITGPDQDLTEELLTDLLKTLPLSCRCDPQDWRVTQSAQWIEWISGALGLRDLSVSKLCIEGRVLCSLPQSELVRIVPSCGDVLFVVLKEISLIYKTHAHDHCKHHS